EIIRGEPVVDGDQHGADLRDRVKRFQLRVRVRRDVGHAVASRYAQLLQRRGPPIAPLEELRVRKPQRAVHDRLAVRIQRARPSRELKWSKRYFHVWFTRSAAL